MSDSRTSLRTLPSGPAVLRAASLWLPAGHSWRRLPMIGLVLAVVGLGGSLALGLASEAARRQLWHSWLVGALFALSIALGGLFFVLVHHATQAGWSVVVRRIAENAMATLPFLALLFVPLLFGMGDLFHWSHAEAVKLDPLLLHKQPYLNVSSSCIRTVAYFVVWSALALWFGRLSRLQDDTGDHELTRRMRRASPPALLLFALTVTFFAFDWLMSLEPDWYSTIFGVYFFAGSAMAFFAFLALVMFAARRAGLLAGVVTTSTSTTSASSSSPSSSSGPTSRSPSTCSSGTPTCRRRPFSSPSAAPAPGGLARRASPSATSWSRSSSCCRAPSSGTPRLSRRRRSGCWPCTCSTYTGWSCPIFTRPAWLPPCSTPRP